jgi:hypothetical protein
MRRLKKTDRIHHKRTHREHREFFAFSMVMDITEAQKRVSRERARWFSSSSAGFSDDELLRRRERLFNGITIFLALAILPTWFFGGGPLGLGVFLVIGGEIVAARHCSHLGNECRDARAFLTNVSHESSM